ncbi:hypothetical protein BB558_006153, partial [Smittium angustum]
GRSMDLWVEGIPPRQLGHKDSYLSYEIMVVKRFKTILEAIELNEFEETQASVIDESYYSEDSDEDCEYEINFNEEDEIDFDFEPSFKDNEIYLKYIYYRKYNTKYF